MLPRRVCATVTLELELAAIQPPDDPSVGYRAALEDVQILRCNGQPPAPIVGMVGRHLAAVRCLRAINEAFPGWRHNAVWEDAGKIERADRAENAVGSLAGDPGRPRLTPGGQA